MYRFGFGFIFNYVQLRCPHKSESNLNVPGKSDQDFILFFNLLVHICFVTNVFLNSFLWFFAYCYTTKLL